LALKGLQPEHVPIRLPGQWPKQSWRRDRNSIFSKWADMLMLILLAGRERTEAEFQSLLAAADNVIETGCRLKLLVASPVT
jgi:hypothetical protein